MSDAAMERSRLSGWCTAPIGARPQHEGCRYPGCSCPCHGH